MSRDAFIFLVVALWLVCAAMAAAVALNVREKCLFEAYYALRNSGKLRARLEQEVGEK